MNAAALAAVGRSGQDMRGQPLLSVIGRDLYAANLDLIRSTLAGHPQKFVRLVLRADGREAHLDCDFVPLPGDGDRPPSFLAVGFDVSAQVAAEVLRRDVAPFLATVREREQVADDLESTLLRHLDALVGDLSEAARAVPAAGEALAEAARLTEAATRQLRASIHNEGRLDGRTQLAAEAERLVQQAEQSLGFAPTLALRGPVERVGPALAAEVLAVVGEGLSNVVRHAQATQVVIAVSVTQAHVTVTVADDGKGTDAAKPGGSMANLRARAQRLGGTCEWRGSHGVGTVLEWRVPLADHANLPPAPHSASRLPAPRPSGPQRPRPARRPDAARLLEVLDYLPSAVGVWDTEMRNVFANQACLRWLGADTRAQVLGRRTDNLLSPEVRVASHAFIQATLAGEPQHFERSLVDGSDASRFVQAVFTPLVAADGAVTGYVAQVHDVTARVRSQQELRENLEQMTAVEERRRIAEDLHEVVIQHLFAAGLRLDSARNRLPVDASDDAARVSAVIMQVDDAIARLRDSIAELRRTSSERRAPQPRSRPG